MGHGVCVGGSYISFKIKGRERGEVKVEVREGGRDHLPRSCKKMKKAQSLTSRACGAGNMWEGRVEESLEKALHG